MALAFLIELLTTRFRGAIAQSVMHEALALVVARYKRLILLPCGKNLSKKFVITSTKSTRFLPNPHFRVLLICSTHLKTNRPWETVTYHSP